MTIEPGKASQMVANEGPRFYFETMSATGSNANLDHEMWRLRGVRFLVHLDVRYQSPEESAIALVDNVETFKANYLAAQPAGTAFPGYGIRLAALGGWYGYEDFNGLLPYASHHPSDTLDQYVDGFTYSPENIPQTGTVTTTGHTPTRSEFKIASGSSVFGRPEGGLKNNEVRFSGTTTTVALRGSVGKVTGWVANVATLEADLPAAPVAGDTCVFSTGAPPGCYRFVEARASLSAWTNAFFEKVDAIWPEDLEVPEFVACTTENLGEPDTEWRPLDRSFPVYVAAAAIDPNFGPLTDQLSLGGWITEYGKDLNGATISLSTPGNAGLRSPAAQDQRSLAYGAFIIGLAWTWQICFVDRMKQTWPETLFHQYQLHNGNRNSPLRTQPAELFYHGEPWPPDVGHSHDEYYGILPMFTAGVRLTGVVQVGISETSFVVLSTSPFVTYNDWGDDRAKRMRFDPATATVALQNVPAIMSAWNSVSRTVTCSTLPETPKAEDKFYGYGEEPPYFEWAEDDLGWAVWKAFEELYGHAGTYEERYRKTCISWAAENAERLCDAWPRHSVAPFVARTPEFPGSQTLSDLTMYPDGPLVTPPGYQTKEDWIEMLSRMMDAGMPRMVVFESSEAVESVLDDWTTVLTGVREVYFDNLQRYEQLAGRHRNRNWRDRHLWRV